MTLPKSCPFCDHDPCQMEDECRSYAAACYRASMEKCDSPKPEPHPPQPGTTEEE